MKQSNIILGIGILVAVILIAGSLFLKAGPKDEQSAEKQLNPVSVTDQSIKKITLIPITVLSQYFIKIH